MSSEPWLRVLWTTPLYAPFASAAFILGMASGTVIPAEWVIRPIAVAVAAALGTQAVITVTARDRHLGGALAATVIAAVAGVQPALVIGAAAAVAAVWSIGQLRGPDSRIALANITPAGNLVAGMWLAVAAVGAAGQFADLPQPHAEEQAQGYRAGPDFYVLLLDGYARHDTLAAWGFDNSPFLEGLEERRFDVAENSRSDYDYTGGTVPSVMQMSLLDDLDLEWPQPGARRDQLVWTLSNNSPALQTLETAGYETYATESHSAPASVRSVDHFLETGFMTEFEASLIEGTRVDSVINALDGTWFPDQYRRRILANFASVREVAASPSEGPRFVWAHVLTPHAPFVLDADGSLADPVSCYPDLCGLGAGQSVSVGFAEFVAHYTAQISYVNTEVLRTVDAITRGDSSAVVVILSDHGSRYDAQTDYDEWFRTLFAARTPGYDALYGDNPRPRELFPTFFEAYLDADLPESP